MRDVRARPAAAVERIDPRPDPVDRLAHRAAILQGAAAVPWRVHAQKLDQRHDVAALDPHVAVHEGLGRAEPRVEDDAAHRLAADEANRDLRKTGRRRADMGSEEHTSALPSTMRHSY